MNYIRLFAIKLWHISSQQSIDVYDTLVHMYNNNSRFATYIQQVCKKFLFCVSLWYGPRAVVII